MARALISQNDTGCASRSGRMGLHQLNSSPAWNNLCCQEPCTVPTSNINMQTPAFCSNRHIPRGNFMAVSTSESICNPSLWQVLQKAMPLSDSSLSFSSCLGNSLQFPLLSCAWGRVCAFVSVVMADIDWLSGLQALSALLFTAHLCHR